MSRTPQARTPEEFDLYLEVITATDPHRTIERVEQFSAKYPESALLGIAYQYQMTAYKTLGNYEATLAAGNRALQFVPDNLNTLLTLALVIPNGVEGRQDSSRLLQQAEEYATRALEGTKRIRIPRELSPERWESLRGEMESQAHEALALVAAKTNRTEKAVVEMEKAALSNPVPQGSQFYRLGLLYQQNGQSTQAENALRRAATLGPQEITALATQRLKLLPANHK